MTPEIGGSLCREAVRELPLFRVRPLPYAANKQYIMKALANKLR